MKFWGLSPNRFFFYSFSTLAFGGLIYLNKPWENIVLIKRANNFVSGFTKMIKGPKDDEEEQNSN